MKLLVFIFFSLILTAKEKNHEIEFIKINQTCYYSGLNYDFFFHYEDIDFSKIDLSYINDYKIDKRDYLLLKGFLFNSLNSKTKSLNNNSFNRIECSDVLYLFNNYIKVISTNLGNNEFKNVFYKETADSLKAYNCNKKIITLFEEHLQCSKIKD